MTGADASAWDARASPDWPLIEGVWGAHAGRLASPPVHPARSADARADGAVLRALAMPASPRRRPSARPSPVPSPPPEERGRAESSLSPPTGGRKHAQPSGRVKNELYKTELCKTFVETSGYCKYGAKCQFAHGHAELRPVRRHPRYKTRPCRNFISNGFCPYGVRCRFIHAVDLRDDDLDENDASSVSPDYPLPPTLAQSASPAAYALQVATQESLRLATAALSPMYNPDLFQRQQHSQHVQHQQHRPHQPYQQHQLQDLENRHDSGRFSDFGVPYDAGLGLYDAAAAAVATETLHPTSYSSPALDSLASDFLVALAPPSQLASRSASHAIPRGQALSQLDLSSYGNLISRNSVTLNDGSGSFPRNTSIEASSNALTAEFSSTRSRLPVFRSMNGEGAEHRPRS